MEKENVVTCEMSALSPLTRHETPHRPAGCGQSVFLEICQAATSLLGGEQRPGETGREILKKKVRAEGLLILEGASVYM